MTKGDGVEVEKKNAQELKNKFCEARKVGVSFLVCNNVRCVPRAVQLLEVLAPKKIIVLLRVKENKNCFAP